MNVSMQDSFNLGWKLGLVVKGLAHASILDTYGVERRAIARELIEFDHKWSRLFSGRPAKDVMDLEGISVEEFRHVMEANMMFFTGLSVKYGASMLVAKEDRQELASNIKLGTRLASQRMVNQSDGRVWELQRKLVSDGRFRMIVFAGDVTKGEQQRRLQAFCRGLRASVFLERHLNKSFVVLTCHSAKRREVELLRDVPDVLHAFDTTRGWDYDSVYADDDSYDGGCGEAYTRYGVDRERGCIVTLRPDQHVGQVESVDEAGVLGIERYMRGVLVG